MKQSQKRYAIVLLFLLALQGCKELGTDKVFARPTMGDIYRVELTFSWTSANNPSVFGPVPKGAHFSPVVLSVHKQGESFFQTGQKASKGVKVMAETGGTKPLLEEIGEQIKQKTAYDGFADDSSSLANRGAAEIVTVGYFRATGEFSYVSLVSMIAPSPDWFIAPATIALKEADGSWKTPVIAELHGYDAGTDSGPKFTSPNEATDPPGNIVKLPGAESVVFATVTITKI